MENEYRTRDLYEAAYLVAKGLKVKKVEKVSLSSRCFFVFDNPEKCRQIVVEFWNKEGSVEPKTYAEAVRNLKDRIYAGV